MTPTRPYANTKDAAPEHAHQRARRHFVRQTVPGRLPPLIVSLRSELGGEETF
jgi:hypothetical protein